MDEINRALARLRQQDLIQQAQHRHQVHEARHSRNGWATLLTAALSVAARVGPFRPRCPARQVRPFDVDQPYHGHSLNVGPARDGS
jgi:hypothetical protein